MEVRAIASFGPALIVGGALGTGVAMFLPVHGFGGEDWTWWEYLNGLDIALLAACVIAAGFGLGAPKRRRREGGSRERPSHQPFEHAKRCRRFLTKGRDRHVERLFELVDA